jgi:hypothetical protein
MSLKCLKIPKGLLEAVNRRRTDNTMAKKEKRTYNDLQNIHRLPLDDRIVPALKRSRINTMG